MTMLLDQHWYASTAAVAMARGLPLESEPHLTPDGRAVLVCDFAGGGRVEMIVQGADGHDLMAEGRRVAFNPAGLPDLARLVEFDHLPESRRATSWLRPGSKLA